MAVSISTAPLLREDDGARTAVLGAILVTGYLGGAVATQVRVEDPSFLS